VAAAIERGRHRDLFGTLLVVVFGLMSAFSRRHVSVLAVVTAPAMAATVAEVIERIPALARRVRAHVWSGAAAVALLALLIGSFGLPWPGGGRRRPGIGIAPNMPVEAMEFVRREGLQGKLFATMAFASYATWAGWPAVTTFVDSRLEIFGGDFLRLYRRASRRARDFRFVESNARFDLALLSWRLRSVDGAVEALRDDPAWSLVYFDDIALLYARWEPGRQAFLEHRSYRALDPPLFLAGRGFLPGEPPEIAEDEARRAVEEARPLPGRHPMNATAHLMLGSALQMQGRHAEAAEAFRASLAVQPDAPAAYGLLAISLEAAGDAAGAREALEELRRRFPDSKFARKVMEELGE
jgi:tetratricopeptide (TPR) repeat protein